MIIFFQFLKNAKHTKTPTHLCPPTHGYKIKQIIISIKKITKENHKEEKIKYEEIIIEMNNF
jgi:hypothetical protein